MTLLAKPFSAASRTQIWPRIRMYPLMLQKRTLLLEVFSARITGEKTQIFVFLKLLTQLLWEMFAHDHQTSLA